MERDTSGIDDFITGQLKDRNLRAPDGKIKPLSPSSLDALHAGSQYLKQQDPLKENLVGAENSKAGDALNMGNGSQGQSKFGGASTAAPKLAYGKTATTKLDSNDVNDRVHILHNENLKLKEKENLLELEIKKMQTKLRRIEELMKIQQNHASRGDGAPSGEYHKLQNELEETFGNFQDENSMLKERVRKLKTIYNGLSSQIANPAAMIGAQVQKTASKTFTQKSAARPQSSHKKTLLKAREDLASVTGSQSFKPNYLQNSMIGGTHQQQAIIAEMRQTLARNEKEIIRLQSERHKLGNSSTGSLTTDDLLRKIHERDSEIRDIQREYDKIEADFIKKEKIFVDSKAFMEEVSKQIQEQRLQNTKLASQNMLLHIQFSQTKSMEDSLRDMDAEKQNLETAIRRITSEPFLSREKGGVQSTAQRIAELETKLIEKEKLFKQVKEQDIQKQATVKDLVVKVERLKGERDLLVGESRKEKEKYAASADIHEEFNVYQTLFKMDPQKYGQAITDLNQKPESYPVWAGIDFLERAQETENKTGGPNDVKLEIKQLRFEIEKLRHENKDFAAELEKAQNLLMLQKDIERDNSKYYEQEKSRLIIMSHSVQAKVEELARRADEKYRQLTDITKKLEGASTSHLTSSQLGLPKYDQKYLDDRMDAESEFSAVTNESEIKPDENVLDLVVQDAEFYFDSFKTVMDDKELLLHQKTLVTFITVDFYNHDTETSQLAEGYRPLYNTQFAFKNRVDDFYVQHLQRHSVKLDIYISKNNAAVHLGYAELLLRELVERETAVQDASYKTPVVQKTLRIFGVKNRQNTTADVPLGSLKVKMRMRRPVGEAVRYFRERSEIENIKALDVTRGIHGVSSTRQNRRKLVTVQIVGCKDLKVKYGDVANISPFFYYQFYDFDERYSATAIGKNPIFEDTQNYEVLFDAKMINYLQRESLEVILFDDNAPIAGLDRGAQASVEQADDMIGSVMIPLADLVKGASIYDRFPIRKLGLKSGSGTESVGTLEVKISVIDLDLGEGQNKTKSIADAAMDMHYNKQWENELIYRVSKRLARIPGDVEILFGIFARGQKSCTKEDFKYTCLQRLQLSKDITEREIDMFLRSCVRLQDKEIVTIEDFLMLFSASITQARHDILDEDARQSQTIKRYEQMQQQSFQNNKTIGRSSTMQDDSGVTNVFKDNLQSSRTLAFSEQEVLEILAKMRLQNKSGDHEVLQRMKVMSQSTLGLLPAEQFILVLTKEGNLSQFEGGKVSNFFSNRGNINIQQFEEYLRQSLHIQALNSATLQKFQKLAGSSTLGEALARQLMAQDLNKDGFIRLEGFKAAILCPEFQFKIDEANEAFQLLANQRDDQGTQFAYREYLLEQNPSLKGILGQSFNRAPSQSSISQHQMSNLDIALTTGRNNQTSLTHPGVTHDLSLNESRISAGQASSQGAQTYKAPFAAEDAGIRIIKNKMKQYMQQQDITLATLFKLIDTNSDQQLTINEFKQKLKALQVPLDDSELHSLFQHIDRGAKGIIDYHLFVQEFPDINISYMIKKIKGILVGSKISIETVFMEFCSDKVQKRMTAGDFKRFVKKYIEKAADHEVDSLFKHFASAALAGLANSLTLADFTEAFGREVQEASLQFTCSIEDIIKPLSTKIQKFNVNVSLLFEKYDKNHNRRLSADELASALQKDMKIVLAEDEIMAIRQYFKNRHNSTEIGELDFIALINTKFERVFDEPEAKRSLALIKQRVYGAQGRTAQMVCQEFDTEGLRKLSLRNFKHALHSTRALTPYQVDNLTKYLDQENDGFISIDRFDVEIRGAPNHNSSNPLAQSFGGHSSSASGKRTFK